MAWMSILEGFFHKRACFEDFGIAGLVYRGVKKIEEALTNLLDGKTALEFTMIAASPAVIVLGSASQEEKTNGSKKKQA